MGSDFVISEQVHRGVRSRISRATQRSTGQKVVLKESTAEVPFSVAVARLSREYAIAKAIRSVHVVRYLGLKHERDRVALVEEAFGASSSKSLSGLGRSTVRTWSSGASI